MVEHSAFDRLIGVTLGNYFLEQLIEQSESGCVFRARNAASGTLFRLRILVAPPNLTPEDRIVYLGHVQQEANRVASLQHTHILPLIDYATHGAVDAPTGSSWPYLVSPYLPMKSLSAQLAQKGPVDVALASRYLDQIASALEYAHQQGVLHRNLTTDCIFVRQDGDLLVADFGVIRMLEAGARYASPDTRKGVYGMNEASAPAPEQILGQTVDTYTDVYALGAVLYRLLTGHRVFKGKTREEINQQHLQAPIPSLTLWRSDLPKALDDVIARAMAKKPAQRYLHPGEVANAYHQIVAPHDIQRVPFFVAPASTTRSGQSQGINSGSDERVHGGDAQQGASVKQDGGVQQGASLKQGGGVQGRNMQGAHVQGGGKPRPYISRNVGDRQSMQSAPISRRRALTFIAAGGGVAVAVFAVAAFGRNYLVGNTSPASTPGTNATEASSNGQILAHTSDISLNSAKAFPISGHNNPGLIIHLPDGRFVAFDSTCTHAGCAVHYSQQDKLLECPCHGAIFDPAKNAAVIQGPAQTPLASLKISVHADGTITQG
jgi:serine/threonine protein kinase/Rieske Fe-S protein